MQMNGSIDAFERRVKNDIVQAITDINSCAMLALQRCAHDLGFVQLMPIMLSPFTDPLNHAVYPADIQYEGRRLKLTASMIFHKQLALGMLRSNKVFIVSPNIRLEKDSVKNSANHLLEFSQFDMEMRDATMHDAISVVDTIVRSVIGFIRTECASQLKVLNRDLPIYNKPFATYSSDELRAEYGEQFEMRISQASKEPCFVTNFKREFYDRETPGVRGQYNNFDLIYSEGFGEALSGAEREFEYEQILYRMRELNMDLTTYGNYLEASRRGLIPKSAGAGLGIQRFVKFLTGRRDIAEIGLFDRSISSDFLF